MTKNKKLPNKLKNHVNHRYHKEFTELIVSVARLENALANAINAVTRTLQNDKLSHEEINNLIKQLEKFIRLAIKKEMVLETLIQDIVEGCEKCKDGYCNCKYCRHYYDDHYE